MRIGNLTQTVWKRSVKKQLHKRREAFLTEPLNGERCSAMKVDAQTSVVVAANASANGNTAKTAVYAAIRAVNDLACRGADPAGIRLQCFLPEAMTEEQFRDLIGEVEAFCEEHDLELINVAAETSPAVRQIFVQAGAGGIGKNGVLPLGGASKGDEIVLCGSVGLEGALRILEEQEAELSQRFVPAFLRQTKAETRALPAGRTESGGSACARDAADRKRRDPGGALGTVRGGRSGISGCDGTDDDLSGDGGDL